MEEREEAREVGCARDGDLETCRGEGKTHPRIAAGSVTRNRWCHHEHQTTTNQSGWVILSIVFTPGLILSLKLWELRTGAPRQHERKTSAYWAPLIPGQRLKNSQPLGALVEVTSLTS